MKRIRGPRWMAVFAILALLVGGSGSARAQLLNPSFEAPDATAGDQPCASDWTCFNEAFVTQSVVARTGAQSLKTFGPFAGPGAATGAFQDFPASPGDVWSGEIYAMNSSSDPLEGADIGIYRVEFLDALGGFVSGNVLGTDVFESEFLTTADPQDAWKRLAVTAGPAPDGTVTARVVALKVAVDGSNLGSIFWDDAAFARQPDPEATGVVCGVVRDGSTLAPVSNAGVFLYQNDAYTGLNTATAADGTYCIGDVPVGTYDLQVRVDDYQTTWRRDVDVTESTATSVDISPARGLRLAVPWPNPASSTVSFELSSPEAASMELRVFDPRGRLVKGWAGRLDATGRTLSWNLRDHSGQRTAAGVYLVQLRVGNDVVTRSFLCVR